MSSICCNVMVSKNHMFKYYDQKKITPNMTFEPISRPSPMIFSDFEEKIKNWKNGDSRQLYINIINIVTTTKTFYATKNYLYSTNIWVVL